MSGKTTTLQSTKFSQLGYTTPIVIEQVGLGDVMPPSITNVTVETLIIDTFSQSVSVPVRIEFADDVSGLSYVRLFCSVLFVRSFFLLLFSLLLAWVSQCSVQFWRPDRANSVSTSKNFNSAVVLLLLIELSCSESELDLFLLRPILSLVHIFAECCA